MCLDLLLRREQNEVQKLTKIISLDTFQNIISFPWFILFQSVSSSEQTSKKMNMYVHEFGTKIFKTDGKILVCNPCEKSISCDQRFQVGLNDKLIYNHLFSLDYSAYSNKKTHI